MKPTETSLGRWLRRNFPGDGDADYEAAAAKCQSLGLEIAVDYLKHIAKGYNRPSYDTAEFLSEKLTERAVATRTIMTHPYTRGTKRDAA